MHILGLQNFEEQKLERHFSLSVLNHVPYIAGTTDFFHQRPTQKDKKNSDLRQLSGSDPSKWMLVSWKLRLKKPGGFTCRKSRFVENLR